MAETSKTVPRNRLALAGFVINCLGFVVFFAVIGSQPELTSNAAANDSTKSAASESTTFESAGQEAMSAALGSVFGSLATIMAAMFLSGIVWIVGSLCCLIALFWKPRKWAVMGLLLVLVLVGGTVLLAALNPPPNGPEEKTAKVRIYTVAHAM